MAFLYSLDNNVPAQISNLCMVNYFSGFTFDMEHRISKDIFLLLSVE